MEHNQHPLLNQFFRVKAVAMVMSHRTEGSPLKHMAPNITVYRALLGYISSFLERMIRGRFQSLSSNSLSEQDWAAINKNSEY